MNVYLDKKVIQSFTPLDYHVQHGTYLFNANSNLIELSFCGDGTDDWQGAVIDNVHVYKLGWMFIVYTIYLILNN